MSIRDTAFRAQAGDGGAFAELVGPHLRAALGTASLILGRRADASDVVQDALLDAWKSLHSLRDPDAFGAWFRRIVVRRALKAGRHSQPASELDERWATAVDHDERESAHRTLIAAFGELSVDDRAVLALRYYLDLPNEETGRQLGIPTGTVKSRIHNALRRLRAAYDAEERR